MLESNKLKALRWLNSQTIKDQAVYETIYLSLGFPDIDEASEFHYDQRALFLKLIQFQTEIGSEGIEVTHNDLVAAWDAARNKTGYFYGVKRC